MQACRIIKVFDMANRNFGGIKMKVKNIIKDLN